MAENENILLEEQPEVPAENVALEGEPKRKKGKFVAKLKEWWRKKIVSLKRSPQTIPLLCLLITTVFYMFVLFPISDAVYSANAAATTKSTGICTFVVTLISLLVLVSFLNSFPKRKKPNIFFIVLTFLMIAAMIACDIVYFVQMANLLDALGHETASTSSMYQVVAAAQPYVIVHMVLLGLSAVVFALLPILKKLILKIDTSVVLESATENMQGAIDIHEE